VEESEGGEGEEALHNEGKVIPQGFLSDVRAVAHLEDCIASTPVYHAFMCSNTFLSKHVASVIPRSVSLGFDCLETLLHSFLVLLPMSKGECTGRQFP
jgi:hypothetical protein